MQRMWSPDAMIAASGAINCNSRLHNGLRQISSTSGVARNYSLSRNFNASTQKAKTMHLEKTQNAGQGRDRVSVSQVSVLKAVLEHRGFSPKCTKCAANFDVTELIFWLIGSRDSAENILAKLATLTERQHQIMRLVLDGLPSKTIGSDLRISRRTVENHRAAIMKKTGCHSLPALARWMVAAEMAI